MERRRVVVVGSDPIAAQLVAYLRASSDWSVDGNSWLARDLQRHLASREPVDWLLAALVCPAADNERLSKMLLAQHPDLVILRVDTDTPRPPLRRPIGVDFVQHLALDQELIGFDRLLSAMRFVLDRKRASQDDRLVRYFVLGDPGPESGDDVCFVEMRHTDGEAHLRRIPSEAVAWLNAAIADYFECHPIGQGGEQSLHLSRARAVQLLTTLDDVPCADRRPAPGPALAAATRRLTELCNDPLREKELLVMLKRRLALQLEDLKAFIICLAPELDLSYQLIFGHIHDDMTRRYSTASLVDVLLNGHCAYAATASISALLEWRLIAPDAPGDPSADAALRPDSAILQWLMVGGDALLNESLMRSAVMSQAWPGADLVTAASDGDDDAFIRSRLTDVDVEKHWIVLTGPDSEGWKALLERGAQTNRTWLLRVSMQRFVQVEPRLQEELAVRISRAARLTNRRIVVDGTGDAPDVTMLTTIVHEQTEHSGSSFLLIADARAAASVIPAGRWRSRARGVPTLASRTHYFLQTLSDLKLTLDDKQRVAAAERLASAYPLSPAGLALAVALTKSVIGGCGNSEDALQAFADACRKVAAPDLLQLAHRLEPVYELEQVIVPEDRKALLREVVANVLCSRTVFERWGFGAQLPYGRGVAALFTGASGTGKTMAAQAIARRLGVDVFAVDLSRIVSKYIGETEKHLDAVFADAERSGSVLLFDEADALFGKRSEVNDAHDRYANIEVAYLLQRMEAFGGLAILTTNHRQNLDAAFLRRLRFIVEFPKPDATARQQIWRLCIPDTAPVAEDIEWKLLARFDLSGGVIRQVTLRAAFLAAQANAARISMKHLIEALRGELTKLGLQTAERELLEHVRLRANPQPKTEVA